MGKYHHMLIKFLAASGVLARFNYQDEGFG